MSSLLYIHGFNSSPQGLKVQQLQQVMYTQGLSKQLSAPQLSMEPLQAVEQLEECLSRLDDMVTLVGSSLGGYYATYLAEKYQLKAILLNPVVLPHKLLGQTYHDSIDYKTSVMCTSAAVRQVLGYDDQIDLPFLDTYINQLAELEVAPPKAKERYKVWLKKGDEVLDYRFAKEWYQHCGLQVDEGGDHRFSDFAKRIPNLLKWADLIA